MISVDRHDRKLLERCASEGPQFFTRANAEHRAFLLWKADLLERFWRVYSSHPTRAEYRWLYAITDKGRERLAAPLHGEEQKR